MSLQEAETAHTYNVENEDSKLICASDDLASLVEGMATVRATNSNRIVLDPDKVERGLAQLVLTVIELLRQLMERQALHRVENGTIDEAAIERLGLAFMRLDARMSELKTTFDLRDEDLNIDLGPLGKLM
jgi:hypothetical protein